MRVSGSIAGLCTVLVGLAVGPARADLPPKALEQSKATNEKVEALTARTRTKGDLPRYVVPDEAAILDPFWDAKALIGTGPHRKQDLGALMDMLQNRNALFGQYAGFKPNGVAEPDAGRNLSVFQEELFCSMRFLVHIVGAVIPALNDQIGKRKAAGLPPKALEGFREARDGMHQMVSGGVEMLAHPGLRPENQTLLVNALADNATTLAAGFSTKSRTTLIATIQAALPSLPAGLKDRMQVFITALVKQPCDGLCLIE